MHLRIYQINIGFGLIGLIPKALCKNFLPQFDPFSFFRGVHLGPFDDDTVGREVYTPSQGRSGHQDLDVFVSEQVLHQRAVYSIHSGVVDGESVRQQVFQVHILNRASKMERIQGRVFVEIIHCDWLPPTVGQDLRRGRLLDI